MATIPTIQVAALDSNNDPIELGGQSVFLNDIDAVAMIIYLKLNFLLGEWWENLALGFPLFQSLIASSGATQNQKVVMSLIQQTVLSAPFTLQWNSFSYQYDPVTRRSGFTGVVQTTFGTLTVTNAPGTAAAVTTP